MGAKVGDGLTDIFPTGYQAVEYGNIQGGETVAIFVVTQRLTLDKAPHGYDIFRKKEDGCIKVVMKP